MIIITILKYKQEINLFLSQKCLKLLMITSIVNFLFLEIYKSLKNCLNQININNLIFIKFFNFKSNNLNKNLYFLIKILIKVLSKYILNLILMIHQPFLINMISSTLKVQSKLILMQSKLLIYLIYEIQINNKNK